MTRWVLTLILVAMVALPGPASAGLFSKLGRLADDAAGAGKKVDGVGGSEIPATALRSAKEPGGTAAALGVDEAGTLRLTDELGRATDIRSVDDVDAALKALGGKNITIVADTETLGRNIDFSRRLAERGVLKFWVDNVALPVHPSNGGLAVEIRPNVRVPVLRASDIAVLDGRPLATVRTRAVRELRYAFDKPLTRGAVVVAQFGKPPKGPRKVGFGDMATRQGETLKVTKDDLLQGMSRNRGSTVVLAGKIDGDMIRTGEGPIPLAEVQRAAAAADLHLILINRPAALAHRVIAEADTYGDLVLGLSDRQTPMIADAVNDGSTRVQLSFRAERKPDTGTAGGNDDGAIFALGQLAGHTGSTSVDFFTTDKSEEEDRQLRLIPWLSFGQHLFFGASILFGLLGHRPAWWFWRNVWVLPTGNRPWRIARGIGYVAFLLFTGIFWGLIRYLFGWVVWFVPSLRKPKPA